MTYISAKLLMQEELSWLVEQYIYLLSQMNHFNEGKLLVICIRLRFQSLSVPNVYVLTL
jgi:hypothetical protein